MMMMLRASDIAKVYPLSDARRPRLTSVRNGDGLPGFGRSRLKKLVRVRVGTLNVGSMTGRGRELADLMERRKWECCVCRRPGGEQGERVRWRMHVVLLWCR